jgi:hypothetical protein
MLGLLGLGALALSVAAVLSLILGPHGLAVPAQAQEGTALVLDMNADNGNGPCDPIDSNASVGNGSEYKVAVCLTRSTAAPAAFEFFVSNDRSLDQCVPVDCGDTNCLDSNPDANVGNTTWGASLGTKWSCNFSKLEPPTCDKNGQVVFISCLTLEIPTLPAGLGVTAPLAVMTFKATSEGTDTFSLGPNSVAYDFDTVTLVDCSGSTPCPGGSVTITAAGAPTATVASSPVPSTTPATGPAATAAAATAAAAGATATAAVATAIAQGTPMSAINDAATATAAAAATKTAAGATSTPGGKATAQPTAAAGEGGGSSGPNAAVIVAIVVVGVVVVGGVGWFAWRRLRAG